jgi:ADP-ribose pyrophosphatase YjhB (NUDIX family)
MSQSQKADIQLTSNVVIAAPSGRVLLTRYEQDDDRLWIPGASLEEYEHPDVAAKRAVASMLVVPDASATLSHIESFRGRRGWHVMFNYLVNVDTECKSDEGQWFDAMNLPPMAHGEWEKSVIAKALSPK